MTTYPLLFDNQPDTAQIRTLLDFAASVLERLSPQLAYGDSARHTHRVQKAKAYYLAGNVFLSRVTGIYRTRSSSAPKSKPSCHWTNLNELTCNCEDFQRNGACYHLIACAFQSVLGDAGVATVLYNEEEICVGCNRPMLYQEQFMDYYTTDESGFPVQNWLGAYVCGECEFAMRDDGRIACMCDVGYTCKVHQKTGVTPRTKRHTRR